MVLRKTQRRIVLRGRKRKRFIDVDDLMLRLELNWLLHERLRHRFKRKKLHANPSFFSAILRATTQKTALV